MKFGGNNMAYQNADYYLSFEGSTIPPNATYTSPKASSSSGFLQFQSMYLTNIGTDKTIFDKYAVNSTNGNEGYIFQNRVLKPKTTFTFFSKEFIGLFSTISSARGIKIFNQSGSGTIHLCSTILYGD